MKHGGPCRQLATTPPRTSITRLELLRQNTSSHILTRFVPSKGFGTKRRSCRSGGRVAGVSFGYCPTAHHDRFLESGEKRSSRLLASVGAVPRLLAASRGHNVTTCEGGRSCTNFARLHLKLELVVSAMPESADMWTHKARSVRFQSSRYKLVHPKTQTMSP